jgi:hypothetical protein
VLAYSAPSCERLAGVLERLVPAVVLRLMKQMPTCVPHRQGVDCKKACAAQEQAKRAAMSDHYEQTKLEVHASPLLPPLDHAIIASAAFAF